MIDNAIFKLNEQNNIFLSGTYLRITVFARFLTITDKLDSTAKVTFLPLLRIFSLELSLHSSLPLKTLLFTLKICFFCFFHNLLFQNMLINLEEKESPPRVLLNIWHKCDPALLFPSQQFHVQS